jgi:hypothetical protein
MKPEIKDYLRQSAVNTTDSGDETKINTRLLSWCVDALAKSNFHPSNVVAGAVGHSLEIEWEMIVGVTFEVVVRGVGREIEMR